MTDKHTPGEEKPLGIWLREGSLIYELEDKERRHGIWCVGNRFEISVTSSNQSLSKEECEALAARIVAMNRSYDALLAACEEMHRTLTSPSRQLLDSTRDELKPWLPMIEAALALVEARQ